MKIRRGRLLLWLLRIVTALASVAFWWWASSTITGQAYEYALHDAFVRFRGPLPPPEDVVIVALDEATYQAWGLPMDRPIPRERYGKLLKRLAALGARRVVFDIVFAGASAVPEWDRELEEGVGSLPVVLAADHGERDVGGMTIEELIKPEPRLLERAAGIALVGIELNEDVARVFTVRRKENTKEFSTLSEAGAGILTPEQRAAAVLPGSDDLINFYGPSHWVKTVSLYQVLEDAVPVPARLFKNKTVYVGLVLRTGLGATQKDSFRTPFGDLFGVEIHATMAANLLERGWIRRPTIAQERWVGALLLFGLLIVILGVRPQWSVLIGVVSIALWFVAAYGALVSLLFVTGGLAVTVLVPVAVLINLSFWYLRTRKKQQQIEKAFSLYLSPAMVTQLKRNPSLLKLGGEELVCSAIFTDIAGFTNLTEQLGAVRITGMLNEYFTEVSQAVMEEGGTVIKFIGDAVFALWGAPVHFEDHAARAIRAAQRIQRVVAEFNASAKFPPLITRVGVNTGKMVVGNLGSSKRFDFTAIGDAVNLAARVEGVNKYLGTTVLVTEDALLAAKEVKEDFKVVRMGAIKVVGKDRPVQLFRLLAEKLPPAVETQWEEGLNLFAAREWGRAENLFTRIATELPEFAVAARLYLAEIRELAQHTPHPEWKGEVAMDHK